MATTTSPGEPDVAAKSSLRPVVAAIVGPPKPVKAGDEL